MKTKEAKAEVFLMAFKGLPKNEKHIIIEWFLKDNEFMEDLIDIAVIEKRRKEVSLPLEDYINTRKKTKR